MYLIKQVFLIIIVFFLSNNLQSFSQDMMSLIPINTATHTAVQTGNWFDTTTWDTGTIPSDAAIVVIPDGVTFSQYNWQ